MNESGRRDRCVDRSPPRGIHDGGIHEIDEHFGGPIPIGLGDGRPSRSSRLILKHLSRVLVARQPDCRSAVVDLLNDIIADSADQNLRHGDHLLD